MKIILGTSSSFLESSLSHKLISEGVTLILQNSLDEIIESLPFVSPLAFIDDKDFDIRLLLKAIKCIKNHPEKKHSRIIILTKSSDKKIIDAYLAVGADAILQSSLHNDTIVDKAYQLIMNIAGQNAARKYVRIPLAKEDNASIKLLPKNLNSYISGRVTDISMGGVAAVFDKEDEANLCENTIYPRSQISLDGRSIIVDLLLIKKGGKVAAFSYQKIMTSFKNSLAEFIYFKVQNLLSDD